MPTTIDLETLDDPRDGIHQAVQALVEGQCVRLPLAEGSRKVVLATTDLTDRERPQGLAGATQRASLLVASIDHAVDFLPELTAAQARLLLRASPGELTYVVLRNPDGPVDELPKTTRDLVAPEDALAIRTSGNIVTDAVLSLLPAPVVCGPDALLPDAEVVLNDGQTSESTHPSVIHFDGAAISMVSVGAVTEEDLKRFLGVQVVFVCTGNTCRSPMAEVLLKSMLARELGVSTDELEDAGVTVISAGIAAGTGSPASGESVEAVASQNLDLSRHRSQPATLPMLEQADVVYTMTQGHRASILSQAPHLRNLVEPLSPDGRDIDDPIGGPQSLYRSCMAQIEKALGQRLSDIACLIDGLDVGAIRGDS